MFLHGTNLIHWCQDSFLRDKSVLLCLFLLWFKWSYLYLNVVSKWTGNSPRIIQLERVMYHKCHEGAAGEETVCEWEHSMAQRRERVCGAGLARTWPHPANCVILPLFSPSFPSPRGGAKESHFEGLLVTMEKKNYKYLQCLSRKVQHCHYSKMVIRSYGGNDHFTFLLTNH